MPHARAAHRRGGGEGQEWIWSFEDVTADREAETRAQHLADHDPLTGLPNRRLLEDRLTQALAASQRNRKQSARWCSSTWTASIT